MRFKTLTAWGVFSFCIFIALTILVFGSYFSRLDIQVTVRLQSLIPRILDLPFSILSLLGSFEVSSFVLFFIFLYLVRHKKFVAVFGLVMYGLGHIIEISGKLFLLHPSPPFALFRGVGLIEPNIYIHTNYSYPSGHIFRTSYLIVLVLFLINAKVFRFKNSYISGLLVVFLVLMIVSRIYLAEHWFSDVLGGLALGLSLGLFSSAFVFLDKKRNGLAKDR